MNKTMLTIRITQELKDELQEIAAKENMPVSKVVLSALAKQYPDLLDEILKH